MVKSFSEYIKEHFGAITVEYPPEHMFVKNPNLPQPLSINTWVGGTGRIPKHWNNSPYLSGGFGGSGYGRFGQDPNPDESISNELDNYLNILSKIDDILSGFQNDEYVKIALELKKDIEDGKILLDDMGPEASRLDDLGIGTEIEIHKNPTSGTSGSYYKSPDSGESGKYETFIAGSASRSNQDDRELANILGVESIESIPSLDDISYDFLRNSIYILEIFSKIGIRQAGVWLLQSAVQLGKGLEMKYEEIDERYFDDYGSSDTEYELYDISDETYYDSLKYLIKFVNVSNKSARAEMNQKIIEKTRQLNIPKYDGDLINLLKKTIELPLNIRWQQKEYFK